MDLLLNQPDDCYLPQGAGHVTAKIRGEELTVFTYRPDVAAIAGILIVFDGMHRDASAMRDKTAALAERAGLIVFAPLMDRERFPKWRYDNAGVVRRDQEQPRERWTGPLLQTLYEWATTLIDQPAARLYLFGHSAGGQMLSRVCAYSPLSGTERIVIANPSAYVAPLLDESVPFGFQGGFSSAEAMARLQVYLALPITIYLGQADTGDRNLAKSEAAMRQGSSRLTRGRSIYAAGKEVARQHAWAFNWQLVEVPEIGHSSRGMLDAEQCYQALGLRRGTASIPTAHKDISTY